MEELLGVIASNINMQGPDGKTFRTEAAKTLLALTQDASQVDALVDGGAQAHAVATALARTREGARDGLAALANALAARGHEVERVDGVNGRGLFGRGQIIARDEHGVLWGGSDPRGDGCALGL